MFETFRNAWRVPELRKRILFTLLIIVFFRVGAFVPVPFIDISQLTSLLQNSTTGSADFLNYINLFTGGALQNAGIFSMSVTPYINASIIMQLLAVAIPPLERLQKEGEEGRKRIGKYTRYLTVALGLIQGGAYYYYLRNNSLVRLNGTFANIYGAVVIILCFTAGSALMMWLGEQINDHGVGNGISVLLFSGIISRLPHGLQTMWQYATAGKVIPVLVILAVFGATIIFIVWMTGAERRIPIQYSKRVVGRKVYGGQNTFMPIKVNMSGVMPIIFASSLLMIPTMIIGFMGTSHAQSTVYRILSLMAVRSWGYAAAEVALIIAFAYFYAAITYNPTEMANNLRKNNGAIPGIRPGKPTADFIARILTKIILLGALFLSLVAVLPILISIFGGINLALGGTSLLIVVGVAQDTVQKIESQMLMRHYKGFLD